MYDMLKCFIKSGSFAGRLDIVLLSREESEPFHEAKNHFEFGTRGVRNTITLRLLYRRPI